MFKQKDSGYAALGIFLIGSLTGLMVIANQSSRTAKTLEVAEVRKVSLESEELALYGFSVAKQLFSNATGSAALRLKNSVDPSTLNDIVIEALDLPSNAAMSLTDMRTITLLGPDLLEKSTASANALFESGNFSSINRSTIPIKMKAIDFEVYPSGFGVKAILFESKVELLKKGSKIPYTHYARIPMPPPTVECQILIQGSVPSGNRVVVKTTTAAEIVPVTAKCAGQLVLAQLLVDSIKVKEVVLPKTLDPLFTDHEVKGPGEFVISLQTTRIDDVSLSFGPVTLVIEAPATAISMDFQKCQYRCTCAFPNFEPPTLCAGSTDFVVPFVPRMNLNDPLPAITGNPLTDPASLKILDDWSYAHGAGNEGETHGARLQGMLYPDKGYGKKLACSKVGNGGQWLVWAFDPDNNCQEEFIGSRGALGCLVEGTQVLVGPDQLKPIELLEKTDRIWNPLLGKYFGIKKKIHGPEAKELYQIELLNRSITMTYDHPVFTKRGYVQARQLTTDDEVWVDQKFASIESILRKPPRSGVEVWNLVLENAEAWNEHLIFAEGMAVGDLWMQTELSKIPSHEK